MSPIAQVIVGVVPSAVVLIIWFLDRHAQRKDRKENADSDQDKRISKIEEQIEDIGRVVNDLSTIQKMSNDGLGYIIDGLEQKKILNGTGKMHLKNINKFYAQKGYETLKFHSLEKPKKKAESK